MEDLLKFFQARRSAYHTQPRFVDDVLYTTYSYKSLSPQEISHTQSSSVRDTTDHGQTKVGDLLGAPDIVIRDPASNENTSNLNDVTTSTPRTRKRRKPFDAGGGQDAEIFMFEYGTVVIWGMTESEERRFLSSMCVSPANVMFVLVNLTNFLENDSKLKN